MSGFFEKQAEACRVADEHKFTLYGGARGGGKSRWLRWWLVRQHIKWFHEGHRDVRTMLACENYPILADRQISKIKIEFPEWLGEVKSTKTDGLGFHFHPSIGGGMIALRNMDDPSKYAGAEFAAVAIDELQKNSEEVLLGASEGNIRGSLRWPGIANTRFAATAMPGGIGHLWVKRLWLDRDFPKELQQRAKEFYFVRSLPADNPYLDESYWDELRTLPEDLRRAWVDGDWDVFAGQAFTNWRRENNGVPWHVISPFEIPEHFTRWRAVDWGYRAPFCTLWFAQDPDLGRVFVYRELYEKGLTDRQQARSITQNTGTERIRFTLADPSMWAKKRLGEIVHSTEIEYRHQGVSLTKANNDRLDGKRKFQTMLEPLPDGLPGIQFFDNCANSIRTIPALPYDDTRPEDVDTDAEDHAYDTVRYGITRVRVKATAETREQRLRRRKELDPLIKRFGLNSKGNMRIENPLGTM